MGNSDNIGIDGGAHPTDVDKKVGDAQDLKHLGRFPWKKVFRVFLFRIPLWLILLIVVIAGGFSIFNMTTNDEPVNLRPAIIDAKEVQVIIKTCDEQLDEHNINIREEEKSKQEEFMEIENVANPNVRIDRATDEACANAEDESGE